MKSSNILTSWVTPDVEDFPDDTQVPTAEKLNLVSDARLLIVKPFSHDCSNQVRSILQNMTEDGVIYTGDMYVFARSPFSWHKIEFSHSDSNPQFSGPLFCTLPLDLQERVLQWIQINVRSLEHLNYVTTSLLNAIRNYHTSTGKSSYPIYTLASTALANLSHVPIELNNDSFQHFDAFSAALQNDLLLRLDSNLIVLPGVSHHRSALFELNQGQSRLENASNSDLHTSLMIAENEAPEDDLPDVINMNHINSFKTHPNAEIGSSAATIDVQADDDSIFESQPPTSSQHDTFSSTMDLDIELPALMPESPTIAPGLTEEDRNKVGELEEKLDLLESNPASQTLLDRNNVSVLLDTIYLEEVLSLLNLNNRSDDTILSLLQIVLSEDASYARITSILSKALLSRVTSLSKAASRTLMNLLSFVAEKDARALLDAVLLPIVCLDGFAPPHVEMIIRVTKALGIALQDLYIEKLISGPKNFVLSHLDLIAKILALRSTWNASLLRIFVTIIHRHMEDSFGGSKVGEKFQAIVWVLIQKSATVDIVEHKETLVSIIKKYPSSMGEKSLLKLAQL